MIKRLFLVVSLFLAAGLGWLAFVAVRPVNLPERPYAFEIRPGMSLKAVARALADAGVLSDPHGFTWLGRLAGHAQAIKAGVYLLDEPPSGWQLLTMLTRGEVRFEEIRFIEGWTFRQVRAALDAHRALRHDTRGLSDEEVLARLGVPETHPEGLFFPDTYFFTAGMSDLVILRRAYLLMRQHLSAAWDRRTPGLPYTSPYEALIMASIVEKETAVPAERPLVAAVFLNRLRLNMRLQTDPTVIYGLGERFDGNLKRADLITDSAYNTYTRAGLPPTPIANPGLASLEAALHPAETSALYFVARGDGTHQFSRTLAEHNRAVTQYQKGK